MTYFCVESAKSIGNAFRSQRFATDPGDLLSRTYERALLHERMIYTKLSLGDQSAQLFRTKERLLSMSRKET